MEPFVGMSVRLLYFFYFFFQLPFAPSSFDFSGRTEQLGRTFGGVPEQSPIRLGGAEPGSRGLDSGTCGDTLCGTNVRVG